MTEKIQKVLSGFIFLYISVFTLAPLFHLHPDEDHRHVSGEFYHFHNLSVEASPLGHEESDLPHGEDLELYHILPTFSRVHNFAADNLSEPTIFLQCLDMAYVSPYYRINTFLQKRISDTILSPQWDNYILYAASISPPLA